LDLTKRIFFIIILIEIDFQFLLKNMQANTATKFLPIVSDEKKLEVSLAGNQAIIKLSTWTKDLGWCCQKTLALDARMLDDLHRVIASARYKLNGQKAEVEEKEKFANVLKFPNFS